VKEKDLVRDMGALCLNVISLFRWRRTVGYIHSKVNICYITASSMLDHTQTNCVHSFTGNLQMLRFQKVKMAK